jgi:hypothetical protein
VAKIDYLYAAKVNAFFFRNLGNALVIAEKNGDADALDRKSVV